MAPVGGATYDLMRLPLLTHHEVVHRRHRELIRDQRASDEADLLLVDIDLQLRQQNHRNLRHLQSSPHSATTQQLGALYQGYGAHYIDLWVGNPPQRQTAIVDTATSATAFPCSECTNCGKHTDPPFDERKSESFHIPGCTSDGAVGECTFGSCQNKRCIINHKFGSGSEESSWTAFEAKDIVYAGGLHDRPIDSFLMHDSSTTPEEDTNNESPLHASEYSFPLTFGCQTSVSGYFQKQLASGVIGLDRRAQSFWGQMRATQTIHKAQFSLCFVRQPTASTSGTTAGSVMLGGVDKRLHKTPMVFAKVMGGDTSASYKVHVRKMYLRVGHSMTETIMFDTNAKYSMLQLSEDDLNGEEKFSIDSGATDTYFIRSISDEFRKYWKDVTGLDYSNDPIPASNIDVKTFPTIILQMVPHEGGVGDEVQTNDPRNIPGLAGKMDLGKPNDVMFAIPANHYMQWNERDNTYSARVYLDRDDSLGNVIGANSMAGHDILFDMDHSRIGLAESDCDYSSLVGYDANSSPWKLSTTDEGGSSICSSLQCRGVFGVTLTLFFIGFFVFGRRYVNGGSKVTAMEDSEDEFEMKSNRDLRFREDDNYADNNHKNGSRKSYSDRGHSRSSSYSDRPRSKERSSRNVHGHIERGHGQRKLPHYSDRSLESSSSSRRNRDRDRDPSPGADKSVGSGSDDSRGNRSHRSHRSSHSNRSSRSHRSSHSHHSGHSSRSHRSSSHSHRSSHSRESDRRRTRSSSGSRERSPGGGSSSRHSSGSRRHGYSDSRESSRRSYRSYDDGYDYDDDVPLPPSIT